MDGAILLLPVCAFKAWTGTGLTLTFSMGVDPWQVQDNTNRKVQTYMSQVGFKTMIPASEQ